MRKNARLPKILGKRIQRLRKEAGLSQEKLGEKIGVSRAYMGYIEQGRNSASLDVIAKIAKALKVPVADLFGSV